MNYLGKVDAVRIYPGGGLVCGKVSVHELHSVPRAVRLHLDRKACVIRLDDLHVFRVARESVLIAKGADLCLAG